MGVVVGVGLASQTRSIAATADTGEAGPAVSPSSPTFVVPSWPITQPPLLPPTASLEQTDVPGMPAPVASALATSGVPEVALRAYRQAAGALAVAQPRCALDWPLLAAIGRVETNHGRFGGSQLRMDGTTTVPIRGPQLNGSPFALITDTDRGVLDGDPVFDRAIGPMQFIPATWRAVARDGNGDGRADPDNIFDAALSAGILLCSGDASLADEAGMRAAVLRYNHSDTYADLVLSLARSYRTGVAVIPAEGPRSGAAAALTTTPATAAATADGITTTAAGPVTGRSGPSTSRLPTVPDPTTTAGVTAVAPSAESAPAQSSATIPAVTTEPPGTQPTTIPSDPPASDDGSALLSVGPVQITIS